MTLDYQIILYYAGIGTSNGPLTLPKYNILKNVLLVSRQIIKLKIISEEKNLVKNLYLAKKLA